MIDARVFLRELSSDWYLSSSFLLTDGNTFDNAKSKSSEVISILFVVPLEIASLNAHSWASLTKAARSAPENPSQACICAILARSTDAWRGTFLTQVYRIEARSSGLGKGTYRSLSRRPGRNIAGSMMSGLLVAAIMKTPTRASRPSISVKS